MQSDLPRQNNGVRILGYDETAREQPLDRRPGGRDRHRTLRLLDRTGRRTPGQLVEHLPRVRPRLGDQLVQITEVPSGDRTETGRRRTEQFVHRPDGPQVLLGAPHESELEQLRYPRTNHVERLVHAAGERGQVYRLRQRGQRLQQIHAELVQPIDRPRRRRIARRARGQLPGVGRNRHPEIRPPPKQLTERRVIPTPQRLRKRPRPTHLAGAHPSNGTARSASTPRSVTNLPTVRSNELSGPITVWSIPARRSRSRYHSRIMSVDTAGRSRVVCRRAVSANGMSK